MKYAGGVVDIVLKGYASWTKAALGHRMVLVALHFLQTAVLIYVKFKAAAYRMASRRRPGAATGYCVAVIFIAPVTPQVIDLGQCGQGDGFCPFIEIVTHRVVLHSL
jgi:hypothetical protein